MGSGLCSSALWSGCESPMKGTEAGMAEATVECVLASDEGLQRHVTKRENQIAYAGQYEFMSEK